MVRVAVIGAGAAGLVTIKLLLERPDNFDVVCYERKDKIGGEWRYTDSTHFEKGYRPNAIYKSLRTNTPLKITSLPGLEYPSGTSTWPTHSEVYQYLIEYARVFDLEKYIKCNISLYGIQSLINTSDAGRPQQWVLKLVQGDCCIEEIFDSVIICTGVFQDAIIPNVNGMSVFKGDVIHSCQYRDVNEYTKKTVLVVGLGPSGIDIAFDLALVAEKVYITKKPSCDIPKTVSVTGKEINQFRENSVIMSNGEEVLVNTVIFATGYRLNVPFLGESVGVTVKDNLLYPCYKQFINPIYPSLMFNGMTRQDPHFVHISITAETIKNILLGNSQLPSEDEMMRDIEREIKNCDEKVVPRDHIRRTGASIDWALAICKLGNIEPPLEKLHIFQRLVETARTEYDKLRTFDFYIDDDGKVVTSIL